jgi:hypothetical protein
MRKEGEKNIESAGKNCDPLNGNNDFTTGVESQTLPLLSLTHLQFPNDAQWECMYVFIGDLQG